MMIVPFHSLQFDLNILFTIYAETVDSCNQQIRSRSYFSNENGTNHREAETEFPSTRCAPGAVIEYDNYGNIIILNLIAK